MYNMKNKLLEFIEKEKLSIEVIADDTKISLCKLDKKSKADLNATELCELCFYLKVDPRKLDREK